MTPTRRTRARARAIFFGGSYRFCTRLRGRLAPTGARTRTREPSLRGLIAEEVPRPPNPPPFAVHALAHQRGMLPRDVLTLATLMLTGFAVAVTNGAPADLDAEDYDETTRPVDKDLSKKEELRCYCNKPECVPQGYMCRGKGCFWKLSSNANTLLSRPEQNTYSGCLEEDLKTRPCPVGYHCCYQNLCNHVDTPEMRNRFNKTLQVSISDQRAYLEPNNHGSQVTDGWFKTATIAVPICGFIVLLMLASLAVRLLQPMPDPDRPNGKLMPHRTSVNGPPLLGTPKVPLV